MTHSKQVSQAFGSVTTSPSATILESGTPSTLEIGTDLPNGETSEPIQNIYELPSRSLVLKTLRAAKSKTPHSKLLQDIANKTFLEQQIQRDTSMGLPI